MTTSDIALENVQAFLQVDSGQGSLHTHVANIIRNLVSEKPADALAQLETVSRHVKASAFHGHAPDEEHDMIVDTDAQQKQEQWCSRSLKLVKSPADPSSAPKVTCLVQNFLRDAAMFEWAGVGFGREESFRIALSLRKLAADVPALQRLRLWGKILGTGGDYYIAEGRLKPPEVSFPQAFPVPGSPEDDVEMQGEGANMYAYWVTTGGPAPWVRLPAARASHIRSARSIKRLFTGDLGSPVISTPWFPGKEQHLLRSQIARITATCTLAPRDWYEMTEEDEQIVMKEAENAEFPEDLAEQTGWQHCAPFLLTTGKNDWPNEEKLGELKEQNKISEQLFEEITAKSGEEPKVEMLQGLEADLEDLKREGEEKSPAWSLKVHGDQGIYAGEANPLSYKVVAVRSQIWPGAVTVAQDGRFANLYVGYGLKCGTLVQRDEKSGLPLRGTSSFMPLVPDDIMDEPADLDEQDEPNPQHKDGESDGDEFDQEEEENAE